jgi:hypothetical protein
MGILKEMNWILKRISFEKNVGPIKKPVRYSLQESLIQAYSIEEIV